MSRQDVGLDMRDRPDVAAGGILNTTGDLLASDKFGLSVVPSLSVFTTFTVRGMLTCLQLQLFCSMMMATTVATIGTTHYDSRTLARGRVGFQWVRRCHGRHVVPLLAGEDLGMQESTKYTK
jgi:hypothetical protein